MPQFLAQTSRGLVDVLNDELKNLGARATEKIPGGVLFDGNWELCYRANLTLRSATRVVMPILDFPAYQNEELYQNVRKHDFTKYIGVRGTVSVSASVRESSFQDQRFVALKVKDAIVDQFREKLGERPNVDADNADLRISVRCVRNQFSLAVDTTGDALFKRGYRELTPVEAPLKEHMAAGLLQMAGWKPGTPLLDPMCGGGTFLIEAALAARKIAPGADRKSFCFQRWTGFQKDVWRRVSEEVLSEETEADPSETPLFGFDWDRDSLRVAKAQAQNAGVLEQIQFQRAPVGTIQRPPGCDRPGVLIVNPPYGQRLGTRDELEDTYRELGVMVKRQFQGWTLWVLSPEAQLNKQLQMKAFRSFPVWNGPLECRFMGYQVR